MSILATIFGSGKVIEKGLDLIDSAWETDTEKLEARAEAKIKLMNAYAPFKIAQRYLAVMFSVTFLVCFFLVLSMSLIGYGDTETVFRVIDEFKIDWIMMTIIGFYFAGGAIESIQRNK